MMMSCDTHNISDILYSGILAPCFNSFWLFLGKLKRGEKKIQKDIEYCVALQS